MEQVEAFRNEAKNWQSGRYLLTNLDTGEMDQAFSFVNNPDGSQSYLYEKVTDGNYYAEYSSDGIFQIIDGGNASVYRKGSDGYIGYDKDNPHPYSTGGLLFYENLFVLTSSEEIDPDGGKIYLYIYNTDKINEVLGTSLAEFQTTYKFDKDGNFVFFTQSNSDGKTEYSYMIEVMDVNAVDKIENPADSAG